MTLIKTFLVMFIGFSVNVIFAQATNKDLQFNTITTALPFMSITPDSRAGALGDAGTALSPSAYSIHWNTASLPFAKEKMQLAISYVPWLRQLTSDINLTYLSGYGKIGKNSAVTGALRFFSLGQITYTDETATKLRDDKPAEWEFTGGYAFKLAKHHSIGLNAKFAYSNLTGGLVVQGVQTKAAVAGAADISYNFRNADIRVGGKKAVYSFGATINNVGNKVSYSQNSRNDFLPTSLKIGNAYTTVIDAYNNVCFSFDIQKLLVPTPPLRGGLGNGDILAGKNNDVGVVAGMLQSFGDAPGFVDKDEDGNAQFDSEGNLLIKKGSKFREELREINLALGIEYNYADRFFVRAGAFYEHPTKGNRRFATFGAGLVYKVLSFDLSYIAAARSHPLANTLRFSLIFNLGKNKEDSDSESKPE